LLPRPSLSVALIFAYRKLISVLSSQLNKAVLEDQFLLSVQGLSVNRVSSYVAKGSFPTL